MVVDHYLVVQRWRPNFDPFVCRVTKIAVWIRVSGLSLEYYNIRALWRVGNLFGRTLKVDSVTSLNSRGKFACICVEISLRRKLIPDVEIGERLYRVEYEGLHLIYVHCGKYDHSKESCTQLAKQNTEQKSKTPVSEEVLVQTTTTHDGVVPTDGVDTNGVQMAAKEVEASEVYGPWILVKRQNRRKSPRKLEKGSLQGNATSSRGEPNSTLQSRFTVL